MIQDQTLPTTTESYWDFRVDTFLTIELFPMTPPYHIGIIGSEPSLTL